MHALSLLMENCQVLVASWPFINLQLFFAGETKPLRYFITFPHLEPRVLIMFFATPKGLRLFVLEYAQAY